MPMEGRRLYVLTAVQIVAALILFWILITRASPWNGERYIGTFLAVAGASFVGLARYQLGKSFSVRPEARELITTGLYAKIRNPIYVFGTVMTVGVLLVLQKPELWIALVVVVVGQTIRARREARVLEAAFGEAYREYRRKTWF